MEEERGMEKGCKKERMARDGEGKKEEGKKVGRREKGRG